MAEIWVRKLITKLRRNFIVDRIKLKRNRISVKYVTGLRRNYIFGDPEHRTIFRVLINRKNGRIINEIEIGYEFTLDQVDYNTRDKYYKVSRKVIKPASFMERELLAHTLTYKIINNGFIKPLYLEDRIDDELRFITSNNDTYTISGLYTRIQKHDRIGKSIIDTYFDTFNITQERRSSFKDGFNTRTIFQCLNKSINSSHKDITVETVCNRLRSLGYGPNWTNPIFYKVILKHLCKSDIVRTITDLSPNMGEKAIVSSILGFNYYYENDQYGLANAIKNGLGLKLNLKLTGNLDKHDIIIADNNFHSSYDIEKLLSYNFKDLIVYIDNSDYEKNLKFKPTRVIRFVNQPVLNKIDYLFLFKR